MLSFFSELYKLSPDEQTALKQKYGDNVIVNIRSCLKNGATALLINDSIKAVVVTNWDDSVTITELVKR